MAAGDGSPEPGDDDKRRTESQDAPTPTEPTSNGGESEEEEDEEDEEEPRLKYATLTKNVSSLYRNGDAASAFMVAGDKMASWETNVLVRNRAAF